MGPSSPGLQRLLTIPLSTGGTILVSLLVVVLQEPTFSIKKIELENIHESLILIVFHVFFQDCLTGA